jgi:hypothetical protein
MRPYVGTDDPGQKDLIVSYMVLRQLIGWVGLLMPFVVHAGALLLEGIDFTNSISAYYYTGMRDVFVSTLVLVGAFLTCYRTPTRLDSLLAKVAGLAAIGIGLFPMDRVYPKQVLERFPSMSEEAICYAGTGVLGFHFVFVGAFFVLAIYLVGWSFRTPGPRGVTPQKRRRNRIYVICAAVMAVSILIVGGMKFSGHTGSIFWPETTAVVAFGVAWLVKGQFICKDPD